MKILYAGLIVVLLCGTFWLGTFVVSKPDGSAESNERQILYYVDPMNPAHISEAPGLAPCGMEMVAVYADEKSVCDPLSTVTGIKVSPEKQALIGVHLEKAARKQYQYAFRTLGRVAAIENDIHRLTAGSSGWVWTVKDGFTGSVVKKNQLLATVYNYEFLTRQQQYLYALDFDERKKRDAQLLKERAASNDLTSEIKRQVQERSLVNHLTAYSKVPTTPGGINPTAGVVFSVRDQLEVAKFELYSLGVTDYQLQQITKSKKIANEIEVRSPVEGIVLNRNISEQQRFVQGNILFEIGALNKVWVYADVFESEAKYITAGMKAEVTLPYQGNAINAVVTETPPVFNPTSRNLKVQLEVGNSDFRLRPDMVVDVEFLYNHPEAVVVPIDAVVDSGRQQVIFVERGKGNLERRNIKTGRNYGKEVEIVSGLEAGELYAVSGTFLLNSESRMQQVASVHSAPDSDDLDIDDLNIEEITMDHSSPGDSRKQEKMANPSEGLKYD